MRPEGDDSTKDTVHRSHPNLSVALVRIGAYSLLLLGFFLRVFHLNDIAVEKAEMMSILWFIRDGLSTILTHNKDLNNHPLNSLLAYLFSWGNETVFTLRWHSVLIGLLGVAVTIRLARDWFSEREGIIAGLLVATSAYYVTLSQRSRGYVGLVTFTFLSFYLGSRALHTKRKKYWIGFVLACALNAYSHLYGAMSTIVISAVLLGWTLYRQASYPNKAENKPLPVIAMHLITATLIAVVISAALYLPMYHDVMNIVAQDNQFRQSDIRKAEDSAFPNQILSLLWESFRPFSLADDATRMRLHDPEIRYGPSDSLAQYAEGDLGFCLSIGIWLIGLLIGLVRYRARTITLVIWLALPFVAQLIAARILPGAYFRGRFLGFIFAPYLLTVVLAFANPMRSGGHFKKWWRALLGIASLIGLMVWTALNLSWLAAYYTAATTEGWSVIGSYIRSNVRPGDLVVCGQHAKTPCDFDLTIRTFTDVQEVEKLVFETISNNPTYAAIPGRVWLVMPHLSQKQLEVLRTEIAPTHYGLAGDLRWGPTGWVLLDQYPSRGENLAAALVMGERLHLNPLDAYRFSISLTELRLTQFKLAEAEAAFARASRLLDNIPGDDKWLPIARQHLSNVRQVVEAKIHLPSRAVRKLLRVGNLAQMIAYEADAEKLTPGSVARFTLYWQALKPIDYELVSFVHITDRTANVITNANNTLPAKKASASWQPGQIITDTHVLTLPNTIRTPIVVRVDAGLFDPRNKAFIPIFDENSLPTSSTIAQLKITPVEWPSPCPGHELDANFDNQIRLIGYDWIPETTEIVLYWSALATIQKDYSVFVHILNRDGDLIAQADGPPISGDYPTSWWSPGELIVDRRQLPTLDPGVYEILVGLYNLADGVRLPRRDTNLEAVVIAPIVVQ